MTFIDRVGIGMVRKLQHPINTSAVILMALYTFVWGFWLANPFWTVFNHAPLYRHMEGAAPEWVWGGIAMVVGVIMAYGVVKPSVKSLERGAFTGAVHWLIIAVFYYWSDWHNTGGITATMIFLYCTFIYLNIRINEDSITV